MGCVSSEVQSPAWLLSPEPSELLTVSLFGEEEALVWDGEDFICLFF